MSVINKMLQDLDSRQSNAREASRLYTKPAADSERRKSPMVVAAAAAGVAVIAVGATFGWRYLHQPRQPVVAAVPAQAPVVITTAPPRIAPLAVAPKPEAKAAEAASSPPAPMVQPELVEQTRPAPAPMEHLAHKRASDTGNHGNVKKREKTVAKAAVPEHRSRPKEGAQPEQPGAQGKNETPAQKAETAYRRGLADVQEGYLSDGIAALEQALLVNPNHDAARQTLVRVLIENKRTDEAMRALQAGLALDARQPAMAMLLARLQIEHGGTGIDTLMRTLPYVGSNGEYHAFLAAALARQQRHREAAEQYQLALRGAPQHGVWLMGLGLSLQAEKRDGDALEAFRKAKASGTLNEQLATFIDSKIAQLSR